MNQKSLDKNKTKELEWEKDWEQFSREHSNEEDSFGCDIESGKSFIQSLLTQQRTELLEEIKENVNHKVCPMCFGYLTVSSTGGKCSDCGYGFGTSADNTNLLNKKDEQSNKSY